MVIGPIIKEIAKAAIRYGSKYYAAEGKAFNRLYTGFHQSKTIGRGVRHGLTAGSIVGSLISNEAPDTPGNGIFPQKPRYVSKTYKQNKTRIRRTVRRGCSSYRYPKYRRYY